jgi:hypothetical protein
MRNLIFLQVPSLSLLEASQVENLFDAFPQCQLTTVLLKSQHPLAKRRYVVVGVILMAGSSLAKPLKN